MTGVWLGIETTTSTGGIALVRDGKLVTEEYLPVIAVHSEKVLPCISDLLERTGISPEEISGIAVSSGPGSYTGLRIGIATAIGLSAGWEIGLKGVDTLRVLASSVTSECPVLACIRARQSEVYAALYESSSPDAGILIPPGVYMVSALLKELSTGDKLIAVGSGRSEISLPDSVLWAPELWDVPRPSLVALIGSIRTVAEGFDRTITPVYLRDFNEKAKSSVR
ncbi:MAG: tRNA (adenosine(37)-N6)-threonylcarbamoyltransferase complex dimerization subunit type 1 TsaB [Candidatus Aegiribacteria sp.]|nr:tRNA (adenosine(37)-N6)-threonylcarbamoyltransferase complex dimerization subunit type 1 TsaB [Candidatus Aegiribacteria sp.]